MSFKSKMNKIGNEFKDLGHNARNGTVDFFRDNLKDIATHPHALIRGISTMVSLRSSLSVLEQMYPFDPPMPMLHMAFTALTGIAGAVMYATHREKEESYKQYKKNFPAAKGKVSGRMVAENTIKQYAGTTALVGAALMGVGAAYGVDTAGQNMQQMQDNMADVTRGAIFAAVIPALAFATKLSKPK